MLTRKVVQISVGQRRIVALCADGTMWWRMINPLTIAEEEWWALPGPPGTGLFGTGHTGPASPPEDDDTESFEP